MPPYKVINARNFRQFMFGTNPCVFCFVLFFCFVFCFCFFVFVFVSFFFFTISLTLEEAVTAAEFGTPYSSFQILRFGIRTRKIHEWDV